MTGLLLCGGKSSRMGSDKGLLPAQGITWAENAYHKLASVVSPIFISVNDVQLATYAKHFSETQLIVDNDQLNIGGPLRGLLSMHMHLPQEDILLFACDLLFMETVVFDELLLQQKKLPAKEAFVFTQDKEAEPLCGIYTAKGLGKILNAYQNAVLGKHSMKHILKTLDTSLTALPKEWEHCFKNINTRQDLNS
ncbi:MAG: molybdenum cofactor guanylyltransferase [Bacteroidota bacterium]